MQEETTIENLLELPDEILINVASNLLVTDLLDFMSAHPELNNKLKSNLLWQKKFVLYFPELAVKTHEQFENSGSETEFWINEFKKEYQNKYGKLSSQERGMIEVVSEGHTEHLKRKIAGAKELFGRKSTDKITALVNTKYIFVLAVKNNHPEIVKVLLDNGADADKCDEHPLLISASKGYLKIFEILLEHNLNINLICPEDEMTLLSLAAKHNQFAIAQALLKKHPVLQMDTGHNYNHFALHEALRVKNLKMAELFIDNGADLNLRWKKFSPLDVAVISGNLEAVSLLLKAGALISTIDQLGNTALLHAIKTTAKFSIFEKLLANGVNLHKKFFDGTYPIHNAAISGNVNILDIILRDGVCINLTDKGGFTPLYHAIKCLNFNCVKLLLSHGANLQSITIGNESALTYVAKKNNYELSQLLLPNFTNIEERVRALCSAVDKKNIQIVKLLLANNVDPGFILSDGYSALHYAVNVGCSDILSLILDTGVDINLLDGDGRKIVVHAVISGRLDILKEIIARGADIHAQQLGNDTALHYATFYGHFDIVKELINNKINLNMLNKNNSTALKIAIEENYPNIVELLLANGADTNIGFKNILSAVKYAAQLQHTTVLAKLFDAEVSTAVLINKYAMALEIAAGLKDHTTVELVTKRWLKEWNSRDSNVLLLNLALKKAMENKASHRLIQLILDAGANPNLSDQAGKTILDGLQKPYLFHFKYLEVLFKAGLDLSLQDKSGQSILMIAVQHADSQAIEFILDRISNVNARDSYQRTALHYAAEIDNQDNIVRLLKKEADLCARDCNGKTAFHYALSASNFSVLSKLLSIARYRQLEDLKYIEFEILRYIIQSDTCEKLEKLDSECMINLNFVDPNGNNIFHYAAMLGDANLILDIITHREESLRQEYRVDSDNKAINALLVENTFVSKEECLQEVSKRLSVFIRKLLEQKNNTGNKPLDLAIKNNSIAMLKLILDLSLRGRIGQEIQFPLHDAIRIENLNAVRFLIENDPSLLEQENSLGLKPLMFALMFVNITVITEVLSHYPEILTATEARRLYFTFKLHDVGFNTIYFNAKVLQRSRKLRPSTDIAQSAQSAITTLLLINNYNTQDSLNNFPIEVFVNIRQHLLAASTNFSFEDYIEVYHNNIILSGFYKSNGNQDLLDCLDSPQLHTCSRSVLTKAIDLYLFLYYDEKNAFFKEIAINKAKLLYPDEQEQSMIASLSEDFVKCRLEYLGYESTLLADTRMSSCSLQ